MKIQIRSILAMTILVIILAACGATVGAPTSEQPAPSTPAAPSEQPSEEPAEEPSEEPAEQPSEEPADEEREVDGTITVYPGTASGPGASIQEALEQGSDAADMPSLVNGVVFRDTDGRIYLATAVGDAAVPTFDGPMLEVLGYANEGEMWDMANAELLGLQEANGIVFKENAQILGTLQVAE